jgi:RND family efflux transporter MFP subunit
MAAESSSFVLQVRHDARGQVESTQVVGLPLRRVSFVLVVGAAGVSLVSLAGCRRGTDTPVAMAPVTVTVKTAKLQELRDTVVAQGAVVAAPTAIFTVVAPESAKIIELPKVEGATVQRGDLLARCDLTSITAGLGASTMEVSAAHRKLDAAKAELAKQESLYSRGYTPRNTYEGAKQAVATAQTAVDQLQAQTTAATALNDRAVVRAPFAGLVTHVFKSVGDVVDPTTNAAVLQLVDPTRVQVAVLVSPSQELRLAPGQAATVAVTGSMETQPATVIVAPPVAGPEGAPTIEVRLALTGPAPPPLGTAVTAEVVVDRRDRVVVLPESAIAKDETGTYVMIAGADGRAHRRDVRVGLVVSHLAEIQSGVTDGDEVIVGGLDQVSDNAAIQIDRGR